MKVINFTEIDSTNKYLKDNYESLDNFSFVSASYQTSGKGREDRAWRADKDKNLLFSFLIKDKNLLKKFKSLSIGTATLVARFLELEGIKNVSTKWPNDVYVNDKKIAGILLEGDVNKFLAVGVGLNVNQDKFDGEYRVTPTSMKLELEKNCDLEAIKTKLFSFIEKHVNQKEFEMKTIKFFSSHNYLLGKRVSINKVNGVVNGIDKDFNILIDDISFSSSEIKLIK